MSKLKLALFLIPFLLLGCSIFNPGPSRENLKDIKSVKIVDTTAPLVIATTTSKEFFPLLEIGFEGIGIKVCGDCVEDVVVNINVTRYGVIHSGKTNPWTLGKSYVPAGEVRFQIDVIKNNKSIYKRFIHERDKRSLKETAALAIRVIMRQFEYARKD